MSWAERGDGIVIAVRVTPRSSRETLEAGPGHFAARLRAPPVEGAANEALVALVAKRFGVAKRDVTLVSGQGARMKRLHVAGDPKLLAGIAASL